MCAKFAYIADNGVIANKEQFKKIEGTDGLFEFKQFQVRVPCFYDGHGSLVLTHGFVKKKDKVPPAELDRAERIRDGYLKKRGWRK